MNFTPSRTNCREGLWITTRTSSERADQQNFNRDRLVSLHCFFRKNDAADPSGSRGFRFRQLRGDRVISTGKQFLGVRYKFGAPSGRTDEFDCSSFTQYVFK
ncbi:hypothetical protein [Paenibacillus ottowii]|uniref:hypothetical protein n=1 Tax=Paenibacillus ottowii TaxID=2315729 RepID=UPI003D2F271D